MSASRGCGRPQHGPCECIPPSAGSKPLQQSGLPGLRARPGDRGQEARAYIGRRGPIGLPRQGHEVATSRSKIPHKALENTAKGARKYHLSPCPEGYSPVNFSPAGQHQARPGLTRRVGCRADEARVYQQGSTLPAVSLCTHRLVICNRALGWARTGMRRGRRSVLRAR
jgi:hypothetical protein